MKNSKMNKPFVPIIFDFKTQCGVCHYLVTSLDGLFLNIAINNLAQSLNSSIRLYQHTQCNFYNKVSFVKLYMLCHKYTLSISIVILCDHK